MVIEWLRIPVPQALQDSFLEQDSLIWTPVLAAQAGFVSKECWRDVTDPDVLHLVIRWQSLEQWKSVPLAILEATQTMFEIALGTTYAVYSCTTYDILSA
jgi:uncharacterized protein (TIGR03792 family)